MPVVSLSPLSAEQLSVYHAVLVARSEEDQPQINLAGRTVPLNANGPSSDENCGKGLDMEPASAATVHQFRLSDLAQLSSRKITLMDPERGGKNVQENDPERTMRNGSSVEDAVRNAFAHGLFMLSEIQFDKKHHFAVVSYSFFCGRLCGNGETLILEKTETGWRRNSSCGAWISNRRKNAPRLLNGEESLFAANGGAKVPQTANEALGPVEVRRGFHLQHGWSDR
ncbi:MAG: hypothetical protein WCA21_19180 [Terracidiphilus sp.]